MLGYGVVAQWLEQGTHNPLVVGSIPTRPTTSMCAMLPAANLRR